MEISPDILNQKDIAALSDIAVRGRANQAKSGAGNGQREGRGNSETEIRGRSAGKVGSSGGMVQERQTVEAGGGYRDFDHSA